MSDDRSRSSTVEVPADPHTTFTAFTDELDLWWVRGPINAFDSGRLVEMRCEPGVGGRIVEVYDAQSGDGLELARITAWEPGKRLAWESSLDDVTIDVLFEPSQQGRSSGSKQRCRRAEKNGAARRSSPSPRRGSAPGWSSATRCRTNLTIWHA